MIWFLYDCLLTVLALLVLPKLWWDRMFRGKYKTCLRAYFSLGLPKIPPKKNPVFLVYAVSMGETKAAVSLVQKIKNSDPSAVVYIASRTETGHAEARKTIKQADEYFFMPFDFSWSIKRFLNHIQPDVVLIVESDFWPNFLRLAKKSGALLFLVSAKISLRSYKRFQKVFYLIKQVLSFFDLICAQNSLYQERFISLGADFSKVLNTGNLKFDTPFVRSDQDLLKKELGIQKGDVVLVVASTHDPEEKKILEVLSPLWTLFPSFKLIMIPRHPERFAQVQEDFSKTGISFISYSSISQKTGKEQLFLVDAMGLVLRLYQIADLAIVGGSFDPRLNGHNIFEPIQAGVPVLFGPHMRDQKDLVECVLSSKAGVQLDLSDLYEKVVSLLENSTLLQEMHQKGEELLVQMEGSSLRTWEPIFQKIRAQKKNFQI